MKLVHNILSTSGRPRVVQAQNSFTEYYLFNSAANLKAYSNNLTDFAYYGYNASNTRAYKLGLSGSSQWVNGQLVSLLFLCSPKEKKQKERAFAAVEKNPVHNARQLAERRYPLRSHRSAPLPCYGRRIFFITPHVAFAALQPTIATSDIFYYHMNHLGSTAFVTDQNQNITQGFLYAPFGEITTEYATFGNDVLPKYSFNAKELDEETGMYYYEARYYKPPVFTSRDAMFEKYPTFSPYAYCANNPVKYVDPSGGKVEPAGEEEAKAYNELKENAPDHVRAELTRLEDAKEVFRIRMGDNITCNDGRGNFGYNTTTEEFDINILEGGEFCTMEKLSHELKHADFITYTENH